MNVRVIEQYGQHWFVAGDVCQCLGLKVDSRNRSYQNHYRRLAPDELSLASVKAASGRGTSTAKLISESGLYKLVMRSDKPEARAFQEWVTRVVLPAIRKDGAYVMGEEKVATGELSEDELVMRAMSIMSRKVERLSQERDRLAQDNQLLTTHMEIQAHAITSMQPAAAIGQAVGTLRSTTVMDFARKLDGVDLQQIQKTLGTMNYLYRRNGNWAV